MQHEIRKLIRKKNQLKEFDYATPGYYFVTICVQNKINCLGEVKDDNVMLNVLGNIVKIQWLWLKKQFAHIQLDEFIIMPNHFHGIIFIDNDPLLKGQTNSKPAALSEIIGAFKATSSKLVHQAGYKNFRWQRSFYDHIIRNEQSLIEIREYILITL